MKDLHRVRNALGYTRNFPVGAEGGVEKWRTTRSMDIVGRCRSRAKCKNVCSVPLRQQLVVMLADKCADSINDRWKAIGELPNMHDDTSPLS